MLRNAANRRVSPMSDRDAGDVREIPEPPLRIDQRVDKIYARVARDGFERTAEHHELDDVDRSLLRLIAAFGDSALQRHGDAKPRLVNVRPADPPHREPSP